MRRLIILGTHLAFGSLGCQAPREAVPDPLRLSPIDRPEVTIALSASRVAVAAGDTIVFTITAHNAGAERVRIGALCGPALDVRVRAPNGTYSSALWAQFADSPVTVDFTCELGPYHFVEAKDSLVNLIVWKAPSRGAFIAIAGSRGSDGLGDASAPVTITVR